MSKRNQRRVKAVLPLKITVTTTAQSYLGTTAEISASGARTILPAKLEAGTAITLEFKHRRCRAVVIWSKPVTGRKNDHEHGLRLLNREQAFWLVNLALQEEDSDFSVSAEMHFDRVWNALKNSKSRTETRTK